MEDMGTILGITFITQSALILLLTSVHLHVFMKTTFQRKCLTPLAVLIWLLSCVNLQMKCKMTIWGKNPLSHWPKWYGFSPVCVLKWKGIGVASYQYASSCVHQDNPKWKCLATLATLIWFLPSVYFQMNYKMTIWCKWIVILASMI